MLMTFFSPKKQVSWIPVRKPKPEYKRSMQMSSPEIAIIVLVIELGDIFWPKLIYGKSMKICYNWSISQIHVSFAKLIIFF